MSNITKEDLTKGKRLRRYSVAAPALLTVAPLAITFILLLLSAGGPPVAAVIFFLGLIATAVGFVSGLVIAAVLTSKHTVWSKDIRERIAADGIGANEIEWFRKELRTNEKRALKSIEASDLMLADAYRETLASRLTATRISRSSKNELSRAKHRLSSMRQRNAGNSDNYTTEIERDIEKIQQINKDAREMLSAAESRLQMIESAASRGGVLADSELALKKLAARNSDLPLALESARLADEIKLELEKEELEEIK